MNKILIYGSSCQKGLHLPSFLTIKRTTRSIYGQRLEIKKCYTMKEEMDRAVMATGARQTPERSAKCEAAKKKHKEFFDRVSTEVYMLIYCSTVLLYNKNE
uniref:Uncharacterized protein n=1 Tax=Parascaris equorum TaxID=6256 RepID=A0A914S7Q7_PAREQ